MIKFEIEKKWPVIVAVTALLIQAGGAVAWMTWNYASVQNRITVQQSQTDRIVVSITGLTDSIGGLSKVLANHERRLSIIESNQYTPSDALTERNRVEGKIDSIKDTVNRIDKEIATIVQTLKTISNK